ncbi:uncharacterized protein APUU_50972S [Aspergillus puulaauensis]|uniref:Uncharacterized protein n=1 Tax=Aspergillus puulaauensis TaxID=1220207 RepID=A0A7R8APB1_9EURO|nr:uncharacterized protein APUU_50972S [Aspergillus puulaauensis]BCS26261.1 hypothetical protein APUU_50972S [Aspergillus puulaauensis]
MHLTTITAALSLLALTAAESICSPGSVGVGIAPSTATDTYSIIADSNCGVVDTRLGHGELCGVYNAGSEVTCVDPNTVSGVTASGAKYGNCVQVSDQSSKTEAIY